MMICRENMIILTAIMIYDGNSPTTKEVPYL